MAFGKIKKINLDLLLEYAANLPVSPRIFTRLSALLANEDTSLDYISSLVKMDPGLAAQILRVTNSALYGGTVKVNDIETAVSRIGIREVQKVLSMVVTNDCFYQAIPAYGMPATDFFDESVDVAITSETLAKRVGLDPNVPYITGLLHRVGMLAINLYLEKVEQLEDLSKWAVDRPIEVIEFEALGMTHLRIGSELLRHWQFEGGAWQAIKNQASPSDGSSFLKETAILTLSIWIAKTLRNGFDPEAKLPDPTKWALKTLSIDPLDIAMLTDDARFEISDKKNMLSMLL